jgi:hypothetical protein
MDFEQDLSKRLGRSVIWLHDGKPRAVVHIRQEPKQNEKKTVKKNGHFSFLFFDLHCVRQMKAIMHTLTYSHKEIEF